jgi:hypothetical protein
MAIKRSVVIAIGAMLIVLALAADHRWFDAHFLPSFFLPRQWYVVIYTIIRWSIALIGLALVLSARAAAARLTMRSQLHVLRVVMAVLLAFVASEAVLRRVHLRPTGWLYAEEEPRRRPDPRLGWTFEPARTGYGHVAGREVAYAFDRAGYRVRRADEPVDPNQPTIICIGESVMFGEGLTWDESIPAQLGAMMRLQSANLAVHGYSTDQTYMRLQQELPHFRQPVAVVALFMTALFGRNLDDDRPHLGPPPTLTWLPAVEHARLVSLARLLVPFREDDTVERGIATTRLVLHTMVDLAHARGATPLIVVPQLGREADVESTLRRRILDESGVPYLFVEIADDWRLSWDRHPNAAAAHTIAAAVADRLRR